MVNNNSKVNQKNSLKENELIDMLKSFRPIPSFSLAQKMERAPWRIQPRIYKYAFQISLTVGIILIFILVYPTTPPIYSSTKTPTHTHTSSPSNFSTPDLNATPAPSDIFPSTTPIG